MKYDDPQQAIKEYIQITLKIEDDGDDDNNEWIFKSYKQIMKINFQLHNYDQVLLYLDGTLQVSINISNKNYVEESLSKIINNYSNCSNDQFIHQLYEKILQFVDQQHYDRLWLKININKAKILIDNELQWQELMNSIQDKLAHVNESIRNSFASEIIALSIEYYTRHFNLNKLTELYRELTHITSAVTHPKISGIIQECGGKIQYYRGNFEKARLKFYECFKSYDEAGSPVKKKILKYLALCSILTENEFNPFESQETQAYSQLIEYKNLLLLIEAYDENDLDKLYSVMEQMKVENDEIINDDIYIQASSKIITNLKARAITNYLKAYKSISFEFLQNKFSINQVELENLLLKLINNGKIPNMKLDFVNDCVVSSNEDDQLFPTITPQEIHKNLKSIDMLGGKLPLNIDQMDIDQAYPVRHTNNTLRLTIPLDNGDSFTTQLSKDSVILRLLYIVDLPTQAKLWNTLISQFKNILLSSIPKPIKFELSQIDQIFSMQRAGQDAKNTNEELEIPNPNNLLNPMIANIDEQVEEVSEKIYKIDLLNTWSNELQNKLNDLTDTR